MDSVWLILAFPLLGSLLCATHYKALGKSATGGIASLAILGAFLVSCQQWFLTQQRGSFESKLASFLVLPKVSGMDVAALVDPLSAIMLCTVTGVAFLIHCYSMGYMQDEEEYGRFFASLNLFVATMVCLVMANNLAFLLVGWGGVGYASYSLIGFYRHKPSAVSAARKAFLINVVGDVGILLALFIAVGRTGAADFKTLLTPQVLAHLGPDALTVGALLLVGAYAKSAQLPFHPWLPDAMEGPTPVSALIHAATMVTAGVYLVVRCAPLYSYGACGTDLMPIIAIFGALTALLGGLCAVVQNDLKRILAYSTMSQLGYMFMAAGVGAFGAAIFHLVTHAFFKALLFLTAGVEIHACHGEQDIRKMGGLGKKLPGAQLAFGIGSLALVGIAPLAGFFSKEAILTATFYSPIPEHAMLWGVGIATALLTAYYTGRAFVLTFWAPEQYAGKLHLPGSSMTWPLAVLSLATVLAGGAGAELMGEIQSGSVEAHDATILEIVAMGVGLVGLGYAWVSHKSGKTSLVPGSVELLFRGCEAVDGLLLSLAAWFRPLADRLAARIDPVFSRLAPDLIRRSLVGTSGVLCQLQGGSLRLYAVAVLASTTLLALFVFGLIKMAPSGGVSP